MIKVGQFFILVIFVTTISLISTDAFAASVDDPKCKTWETEIISEYKKLQVIRKNTPDWKELQIDRSAWNTMDYDTKQLFVANTAKCMSDGTITLRDHMTGKVLATRTLFGGIKIEG